MSGSNAVQLGALEFQMVTWLALSRRLEARIDLVERLTPQRVGPLPSNRGIMQIDMNNARIRFRKPVLEVYTQ
jgi:hypothetical protein